MTATEAVEARTSQKSLVEELRAASRPSAAYCAEVEREREAAEAVRLARVGQPPRRARALPGERLRLPERVPGRAVGDVAITAALGALHRAVASRAGVWPAKRRAQLERLLVELEDVIDDGRKEALAAAATRQAEAES